MKIAKLKLSNFKLLETYYINNIFLICFAPKFPAKETKESLFEYRVKLVN